MGKPSIEQEVLVDLALRTGVQLSDLLFLMKGYTKLLYKAEFEDILTQKFKEIQNDRKN